MSPRRDPDTGQYVSSDSHPEWNDMTTIFGGVGYGIPAADLAGGSHFDNVAGEESQVVDFSPVLDNDEVFVLHQMTGYAWIGMPTTATAEGSMAFEYGLVTDLGAIQPSGPTTPPGPLSNDLDAETDTVDVTQYQDEETNILHTSALYAEAGLADTVNALAAGGSPSREDFRQVFGQNGPGFDRSDEVLAPAEFHVDNVSDHSVNASVGVLLRGRIHDVDC